MKIAKNILFISILLIFILLVVSWINQKMHREKDEMLLEKTSNYVVTENGISIYTKGEGEKTLVFLSGGGTPSPIYDFRSLYALLEDEYKIVVIEKKGYGFSVQDNSSRSIENLLHDSRNALKELSIEGPYILVPHSMSGLEAIYWGQEYPQEVEAIIGLDIATPEAYSQMKLPSKLSINTLSFFRSAGLFRLFPVIIDKNSPAISNGNLSEEDKDIYRLLFSRNFMSKNFIKEIDSINSNIKVIEKKPFPQTNTLLLVSNGEGTGLTKEEWQKIQVNYAFGIEDIYIEYFDCPHYLHNYEYLDISHKIKEYIETNL